MSKEVKPGLFRLEWSDEQKDSIYSLSDEEIDQFEREILQQGLNVLMPSMRGLETPTAEQAVRSKDD